jgi:hypothetical protein
MPIECGYYLNLTRKTVNNMKLTNEEIKEIADRMDDLMWEGFHDIVYDVYLQREESFLDEEISDSDVIKVRKELNKYI